MSRLGSSIQNNMVIQVRRNYYSVTLLIAILVALVSALLFKPDQIRTVIPAVMLLIVGGTTFVFIGGLIFDEREKGILNALVVSPLRVGEYLWAKIISLTFLSTVEVAIMIFGPLIWFNTRSGIEMPRAALLIAGIIILNLLYTLMGLSITVYFKKITDFLMPLVAIMIFLQLPILYFAGVLRHPLLLVIPSAAPVMLIQGAFIRLETSQWVYALGYISIQLAGLIIWSRKAFVRNIIRRMR